MAPSIQFFSGVVGGGGGDVTNPLTEDLDAGGHGIVDLAYINSANGGMELCDSTAGGIALIDVGKFVVDQSGNGVLLAFGGATATQPAMRYGEAAGVIELLRADGTAGGVGLKATSDTGGIYVVSDDGTTGVEITDSKFSLSRDGGYTEVSGQSEQLNLFALTTINVGINGSSVATVDANGLSLTTINGAGSGDLTLNAPSGAGVNLEVDGTTAAYVTAEGLIMAQGKTITASGNGNLTIVGGPW